MRLGLSYFFLSRKRNDCCRGLYKDYEYNYRYNADNYPLKTKESRRGTVVIVDTVIP